MSLASAIGNFFKTKLKGTTPAGFPTSGAIGSNTQALHTGAFLGTPAQLASANPIIAQNWPWNALKVSADPSALFFESFDGTLDTVNKWTSTISNGGILPAVTGGLGSVSAGTLMGGYSKLASIPTFQLPAQSVLGFVSIVKIDAGVATNNYRFVGAGIGPAAPSTTSPVTDGIGFEITPTGALQAVVWSGGSKTFTAALTRPADGLFHRYSIFYKTSRIYWFIDNQDNYVATCETTTAGISTPQVSALGILNVSVNDAALAPAVGGVPGGVTFQFQVTNIADYAKNGTYITDGKFNWRTANVSANGGLAVRGSPVPVTVGNIAAGATGIIGPIDVSEAGNITFTVKNTVAANPYGGTPTLIFEQSDTGESWGTLGVTSSGSGTTQDVFVLPTNTASAALMFDCASEGINFVRIRVTTPPATNGLTVVVQPGGMPFNPSVSIISPKRSINNYYNVVPVACTATEALVSLTVTKNNGTVAAAVGPAVVTAGKTLIITSISVTYVAIATTGHAIVRLRYNPAGVVALGSLLIKDIDIGANAPTTANSTQTVEIGLSVPIEIPGGGGIGVTIQGFNGATAAVAGFVKISIFGHEQ